MRKTVSSIVLTVAFVSSSAALAADPYFCSPERKEACNSDKPCETVPAGRFLVILNEAENSYTRCDKPDRAACSTYSMVKSGDPKGYTTYEMVGRGGFSKVGPNGEWAEAVSLAGMVIVSHGMCFRESELNR